MAPTFSITSLLFLSYFITSLPRGSVAQSLVSYANEFVDPDYVLAGGFPTNTANAQKTIFAWADALSASGPWSVTTKFATPPSGSKHDYMSWAPYWWPDCSKVGNTTELTPEEIWTTCPYFQRDGVFNPDRRLINDIGSFDNLSDAVLYNSIAWSLNGESSSKYSQNVVKFIKTWFLDEATKMNPNLEYAQMHRGPGNLRGTHTGILDTKCFVKLISGVLILRKGKSTDWTAEIDEQLNSWANEFIKWLETTDIALEEKRSTNNHGTFYYNQLGALKALVGDLAGAENVANSYFGDQYMYQIVASGEQPLEALRTRPYHYRAYNLAAMITNARLATYANPNSKVWNKTTTEGATIKNALDFAMTIPAGANETDVITELYPCIAAVASVYGDEGGRYASFLAKAMPNYTDDAYFLWDQPFAGEPIATGSNPTLNQAGIASSDNGVRDHHEIWLVGSLSAFALVVSSAFEYFL